MLWRLGATKDARTPNTGVPGVGGRATRRVHTYCGGSLLPRRGHIRSGRARRSRYRSGDRRGTRGRSPPAGTP